MTFGVISCIQLLVMVFGASSNTVHPENTIKILNTENIVLSMSDVNDNNSDDLEMIENVTENLEKSKKLEEFYEYIKNLQTSESPLNQVISYLEPSGNDEMKKHPAAATKQNSNQGRKWYLRLKNRKYLWKNRWTVQKREIDKESTPDDYRDTNQVDPLQKEYDEFVSKNRNNTTFYKYTDEGKPEENVKDVLNKLIDFRIPPNCSNVKGIGIQAVECIWKEVNAKKITRIQMYDRISFILLIWFCIYLAIAIPLWFVKGWCCCCFRCWFCFPQKTIDEIRKYVVKNPPGVFVNSKGEEEHYNPNELETQLYERIKKDLAQF